MLCFGPITLLDLMSAFGSAVSSLSMTVAVLSPQRADLMVESHSLSVAPLGCFLFVLLQAYHIETNDKGALCCRTVLTKRVPWHVLALQ